MHPILFRIPLPHMPLKLWWGLVAITMSETEDGGIQTAITDDAPGERRRRSLDELAERARTLNGVLTVDQGEGSGTTVRLVLPPYATAR